MKEIFTSMEFRKFISEDLVVGTDKVSYLAQADYASNPIITDKRLTYRTIADEAKPIWRIKKIVEDTITKQTRTFFPEGEPINMYARTDRATLSYV